MKKEPKDYFINVTDENITSFANALLYVTGEQQSADETAKDVIIRVGSCYTSIEQVWENGHSVAILSTEANKVQVLNVVDKRDERDMKSVIVSYGYSNSPPFK